MDGCVFDRQARQFGVDHLDGEHVSVYVPTTPNPTSGYLMILPKSDCKPLDMSVDEALTYVISMGVITPPQSKPKQTPIEKPPVLKESE